MSVKESQAAGWERKWWVIDEQCLAWMRCSKGASCLLGIHYAWSRANFSFYKWGNWNSESWGAPIKTVPQWEAELDSESSPLAFHLFFSTPTLLLSFIRSEEGWFSEARRDQGAGWLYLMPDTRLTGISCSGGPCLVPAPSPPSQQNCMPQAIVDPEGRMRGPPHAEIYSDAHGPEFLIQSLKLFPSPCNYNILPSSFLPSQFG